MLRSQSRLPRLSIQTIASTALILAGCAHTGNRPPAAPDDELERTQRLLMAADDADSLAAAALLSLGQAAAMKRVTLMGQAVAKAPDRPYLVWMYVRLCSQAGGCDPAPIEAQLRALDPANGAGWVDAIDRLQLMTGKGTEQEVVLAELVDARLNPDPPAVNSDFSLEKTDHAD